MKLRLFIYLKLKNEKGEYLDAGDYTKEEMERFKLEVRIPETKYSITKKKESINEIF